MQAFFERPANFWMETKFCSGVLKETLFLIHDVELLWKNTKGEDKNNAVS